MFSARSPIASPSPWSPDDRDATPGAFSRSTASTGCFQTVVTMEDAPAKPDPAPVQLALERLGVRHAWMVGDTPDDIRAARAAAVLPLGIVAPGDDPDLARTALADAGAARILATVNELLETLP